MRTALQGGEILCGRINEFGLVNGRYFVYMGWGQFTKDMKFLSEAFGLNLTGQGASFDS